MNKMNMHFKNKSYIIYTYIYYIYIIYIYLYICIDIFIYIIYKWSRKTSCLLQRTINSWQLGIKR